ncbi:hypothetical protein CGCSCA4_v010526 [Colletotrichum siamense]|uniref:Uncharacterized protein n=1 Tax=Colletotrichum siamense TaxID=690259 RepID=A0A9P5EMV1_COLSI|nr:hypothetical protein CGCSCA4_v010526 [Colletotrichum siamense]KAF4854612.1 hypothetical protein CGCSCA2_v009581 [Colletotrichum siamense]
MQSIALLSCGDRSQARRKALGAEVITKNRRQRCKQGRNGSGRIRCVGIRIGCHLYCCLLIHPDRSLSRVHQLPETDLRNHLGDLQQPRREIPRQARCHSLTSTHPFRPTNRAKSSTLFACCGLNLRPQHPKPPKPKSEKPREARRSRPKIPPNSATPPIPGFACLIGSSIP